MFAALATAAERRMSNFNSQGLANAAWAFATTGRSDPQLFIVLARASEQRIGEVSAQNLANTAWALAKAGELDAELMRTA